MNRPDAESVGELALVPRAIGDIWLDGGQYFEQTAAGPWALPVIVTFIEREGRSELLRFGLRGVGPYEDCMPLLSADGATPEEVREAHQRLQLTHNPGGFWHPGSSIFVVEADEILSDNGEQIQASGVRVLREATKRDLAAAGIYREGMHRVSGCGFPRSYVQLRQVYALDGAKVKSVGLSTAVRAYDRAEVTTDSSTVIAGDDVRIVATGVARVFAFGSAVVDVKDDVVVHASGEAMVRARGRAVVRVVGGNPTIILSEQAVRLDYDKKPLALPRASMAALMQLGA